MTESRSGGCRSCGWAGVVTVLDLGPQPVADDLFDTAGEACRAPRYRLAVGRCEACGLVQLDPETPVLPHASHGHGSTFSGTVQEHERAWTAELLRLPSLPREAKVLDVSGAGGMLRGFADAGHVIRGGEFTDETFDLVIANHSLSHADDLDAAVAGCARALADSGTLAIEFHSVRSILEGGHFDVICHAHRSYLSLTALSGVLARHGLTVTHARALPLHGGVVRLQARHSAPGLPVGEDATTIMAAEAAAGLDRPEAWRSVGDRAGRVRARLREIVAGHRAAGRVVAAYGAPSRGSTLLNFCDLGADELPWTADRSPDKQGRFLPGVATEILSPEELVRRRPDVVLVLVWPLREEVLAQLDSLRRAGTTFLFPLPEPEVVA